MSQRRGVCLPVLLAMAFAMVLAWVPRVFAQSEATTGVIEGTVTDERGGVLPGATVTVRNTATNFAKAGVTGSDAGLRALLLPPPPHPTTAQLPGAATLC